MTSTREKDLETFEEVQRMRSKKQSSYHRLSNDDVRGVEIEEELDTAKMAIKSPF